MVIFCHRSWVRDQPASVDILLLPLLRKQELCECVYIHIYIRSPTQFEACVKSTEQEKVSKNQISPNCT